MLSLVSVYLYQSTSLSSHTSFCVNFIKRSVIIYANFRCKIGSYIILHDPHINGCKIGISITYVTKTSQSVEVMLHKRMASAPLIEESGPRCVPAALPPKEGTRRLGGWVGCSGGLDTVAVRGVRD